MNKYVSMPNLRLEETIFEARGKRVMLDSDLAKVFGVSTMRLNEQFKRNIGRFPPDFAFQLTRQEFTTLISQFAISKRHLIEPPLDPNRKEIGFHVRETAPIYRVRSRKGF